jgi:hypothetical protein
MRHLIRMKGIRQGKIREICKSLDKKKSYLHTGLKSERRDGNGLLMDCQYQYSLIDDSDHHGFLSDDPIEYADPVSEEGVKRFEIGDFGLGIEKSPLK